MERQNAVKAHDVCTSAANIMRALRDIFYDVCAALLQCLHDSTVILLSYQCCLANILRQRFFVLFCISNSAVRCQQFCDCVHKYLELPCDGILLAANCPPGASYAVVTFPAMPFAMSWRPHLHTFAYIPRRHTSRTAMALR